MEVQENIYFFDDVNDWVAYVASTNKKTVSPGGFARLAGVSRSAVNAWIYRDKLITYFKCKSDTGGEYGLIPVEDLIKVKDRVKTKKVGSR